MTETPLVEWLLSDFWSSWHIWEPLSLSYCNLHCIWVLIVDVPWEITLFYHNTPLNYTSISFIFRARNRVWSAVLGHDSDSVRNGVNSNSSSFIWYSLCRGFPAKNLTTIVSAPGWKSLFSNQNHCGARLLSHSWHIFVRLHCYRYCSYSTGKRMLWNMVLSGTFIAPKNCSHGFLE